MILECMREFYKILFKKLEQKAVAEISFLGHINIPKLSQNKTKLNLKKSL